MKTRFLALAGAALAATLSTVASAATVYDIAPNHLNGNCVFNTTCGPQNTGNTFAAQQFTVGSATTLATGSFTAYDNNAAEPTSTNWLILAANGAGGLPGTVLASGNSTFNSRTTIGSDFGFDLVRFGFNVAGITLNAGTYYFGFQAVSNEYNVYLASANGAGAAESDNGGATWAASYRGYTAVASSLESAATPAVPEPATWGLMIVGFGLVGGAMRRRSTKVSFA